MGHAAGRRETTICIAASPGGHIAELDAARAAFDGYGTVWATGASQQADELRERGDAVHLLPNWGRDAPGIRGLAPNVHAARALVARHRPAAIVTNGAGLVVPLALAARARGARLLAIETMARVTQLSLTVRILAPLAHAVVVQWPELARSHRGAIVARPALLEAAANRRPAYGAPAGGGTYVSVGTRPEPFDRLLELVDRALDDGLLPRPVTAQSGASRYRPRNFEPVASQRPADIEEAIASARCVVCHGGTGLVAAAIAAGKRPMVLARRRDRGEHRTEHQGQIVDRLARDGLVVALGERIGEAEVKLASEPPPPWPTTGAPALEEVLREQLAALIR